MNHRFHKFPPVLDGHNGMSLLNLAAIKVAGINWIEFSQRKQRSRDTQLNFLGCFMINAGRLRQYSKRS